MEVRNIEKRRKLLKIKQVNLLPIAFWHNFIDSKLLIKTNSSNLRIENVSELIETSVKY
jgi:hypothetical protein